jgi:hypothetical protein
VIVIYLFIFLNFKFYLTVENVVEAAGGGLVGSVKAMAGVG